LAFLNTIFDGVHPKIEEVSFLPTHQCPKTVTLAQSFVDVSCRDEKGNRFIIEMQCYSNVGFLERACYYASQAYVNQKKRGKEHKYSDLEPVIYERLAMNADSIAAGLEDAKKRAKLRRCKRWSWECIAKV
jgi:predicted transposase/invertase (TIGR01784 family)